MIKFLAGFIFGAAVSGLFTYFVVRDGFQASADEQIENMRQYYLEHPPKPRESKTEKKPEGKKSEDIAKRMSNEPKNYEALAQKYISRYPSPELDDLASRIEVNHLDEDDQVSEIIFDQKDAREKPYLIREEDYMRRYQGIFGADALEYWVQDNVLTVADSDEVLEALSTIGIDAINALLDPDRDSDIVFVRNERLQMEYEVERNDGSYAEWVGGEVEPPEIPKVEQRRQKNKYED